MNPFFSLYKNIHFLPYEMVFHERRAIWFRPTEYQGPDRDGFHIAQLWRGADNKFHVAGAYKPYDSLEEAQEALDKIIVEEGGIIVPAKMVPFL